MLIEKKQHFSQLVNYTKYIYIFFFKEKLTIQKCKLVLSGDKKI